jgi:hypothetical protein
LARLVSTQTSPRNKSTKPKPVYDPALLAVSQVGLAPEDKANDEFLVEGLLEKRVHNGKTQYLVSWQGDWTGPFNSLTGKEKWENEADIEDSLVHQDRVFFLVDEQRGTCKAKAITYPTPTEWSTRTVYERSPGT